MNFLDVMKKGLRLSDMIPRIYTCIVYMLHDIRKGKYIRKGKIHRGENTFNQYIYIYMHIQFIDHFPSLFILNQKLPHLRNVGS